MTKVIPEPVGDSWYLDEDGNWYFGAPPTTRLAALYHVVQKFLFDKREFFETVLLILLAMLGIGVISTAIRIAIIWLL